MTHRMQYQADRSIVQWLVVVVMAGIGLWSSGTVRASTDHLSPTLISHEIVKQVNQLRHRNGLKPLKESAKLDKVAAQRAAVQPPELSHVGYSQAIKGAGFIFPGENLAWNYVASATTEAGLAKVLVKQWYVDQGVADFGHRKNLLNPYQQYQGAGVQIRQDRIYAAQSFGSHSVSHPQKVSAWVQYFHTTKVQPSVD